MDPKELKISLKSAREAIRKKEFKDALKHCKSILKQDKNNYNALVFIGVAAEGLDQQEQAIMAYKKAAEISPEHPLAWQGLAGFYEKSENPTYDEDLSKVYVKLRQLLISDVEKHFDLSQKLAQVYTRMKSTDDAIALLYEMLQGDIQLEKKILLWTQLIENLETKSDLSDDQLKLLRQGYRAFLQTPSSDTNIATILSKYIEILLKDFAKDETPLPEIESLAERYPEEPYPRQILCQVALDKVVCGSSQIKQMTSACSQLTNINEGNKLIEICDAYKALSEGEVSQSQRIFSEASSLGIASETAYTMLAELNLVLHNRQSVNVYVSKAKDALQKGKAAFFGDRELLRNKLDLILASSYTESTSVRHLEKANSLCEKILTSDFEQLHMKASLCLGYANLPLNKLDNVKKILDQMDESNDEPELHALKGWYHFHEGDFPAAQSKLEKALARKENNGKYLYMMARVYRELATDNDDFIDKCFSTLLLAARADPNFSPSFLHLGKYYASIVKDVSKAKRCYQKAFQLDPENEEAGTTYADALKTLGEEDELFAVLKSVTSKATPGEGKWAWLRLGLHQLKHDDPSVAITSLQAALRADITDRHCWECLGEAYMKRGSYTAALKAFTRATELDSEALYCFYQIASIKQLLGEYPDALVAYESILVTTPGYVPALKGAGETNLLMAREYLKEFFHGRVVEHCEAALQSLTRASMSRPDISSLWKLLGDACSLLYHIPSRLAYMKVPGKLISQTKGADDTINLSKTEILALSSRCYGMAVKQEAEGSSLWHDLGLSYYYQAKCSDKSSTKALLGKAIQSVQKALSLDISNYRHWNALGVIATSNEIDHSGLAQHAFIKSIECEANNVVAWTNLGTLYFINNQIELAHEALKVAQSLEPSYVAAWIGQALIAENVGHDDAMDLFRHTTELGMHVEGATGYAHWVCSTLLDAEKMSSSSFQYAIEQMAAVPAASDALAKYLDRIKTDATAYNLYGLLLERQNLNTMAVNAISSAIGILEKEGKLQELKAAMENYARLLSKVGRYEEAVTQYQALDATQHFELCVGLALTLSGSGATAESYAAYETALSLAENDEQRSQVYAAMGMLAYSVNDMDGAKSSLFNCSQLTPPSVNGLCALMALGLLQADPNLSAAVYQEIVKQEIGGKYRDTVDKLTACLESVQQTGEVTFISKSSLAKAVHRNPESCDLWRSLACAVVKSEGGFTASASCAQAARLAESGQNPSLESSTMETLAMLASGFHSASDGTKNAFSTAQKAVLMFPEALSSWCGLLSAVQSQYQMVGEQKRRKLQSVILSLAANLMSRVETELTACTGDKTKLQSLHLWCVKQYVVALLQADRKEQAHKFLQSAVWLYEEDVELHALVSALDQNFGALKQICERDMKGFAWQLLIALYLSHGMIKEVEESYQQWIQSADQEDDKTVAGTKLCFQLYQQILGGNETSIKSFHDIANRTLESCPTCIPVLLMEGLVYMKEKNNRFTKRSFQRVVQNKNETLHTEAVTIARKQLLKIYVDKNDEENIKSLIADATVSDDSELLGYATSLKLI